MSTPAADPLAATPARSGDARSARLAALRLPPLAGRRVCELGCGEGWLAGFALHEGAAEALGIDPDAEALVRARERFPDARFEAAGLDALPEGRWDVLVASATLHRQPDPAAWLARALACLAPDGLLVLEAAAVAQKPSQWVSLADPADGEPRRFPSLAKLRELLAGTAYKYLDAVRPLPGYPLMTHVFHVRARKPFAYLLMAPPAAGKSTIARLLFAPAGVPVVSGDHLLSEVARGRRTVAPALAALIRESFSHDLISALVERLFQQGLAADWVAAVCERAGTPGGDLAYDGYVPATHQPELERLLRARGYLPVVLHWQREADALSSRAECEARLADFIAPLDPPVPGEPPADGTESLPPASVGTRGYVDRLGYAGGDLLVRGWALHTSRAPPRVLRVEIGERHWQFEGFEVRARPDVQAHYGLDHPDYGYVLRVPLPARPPLAEVAAQLRVFGGLDGTALDGPFTLGADVIQRPTAV